MPCPSALEDYAGDCAPLTSRPCHLCASPYGPICRSVRQQDVQGIQHGEVDLLEVGGAEFAAVVEHPHLFAVGDRGEGLEVVAVVLRRPAGGGAMVDLGPANHLDRAQTGSPSGWESGVQDV